jgi:hypothetical protein
MSSAEVCRLKKQDNPMERTYKKIEIVGVSEKSFAEATQNAVAQLRVLAARSPGKFSTVPTLAARSDLLVESLDAFTDLSHLFIVTG